MMSGTLGVRPKLKISRAPATASPPKLIIATDVGPVGGGLLHVVGELALAQRMTVGADELQAVRLADFLDVLLHRPAEGVVGDQQVPALRLRVGLHEVVDHGLRRGVGARRPLERVAVAAGAGDVLGAAAEEVHHLLALGDLRDRERHARGPGADHEVRAFAVDRLFGAPRRGAGLRRAVARDVLDRAGRGSSCRALPAPCACRGR